MSLRQEACRCMTARGWCCAGTEAEALACRSIAERGVQLVATAHGQLLENLIKVRGRCAVQHPPWHLLALWCSGVMLSAGGCTA